MKKFKLSIIICFFVILLIPILFLNKKSNQISLIDNTKLPEISSIKNLGSLENYLSKRIGFRKNIINTYVKLNDILFNKMIHPTYTYGIDNYVFFKTGIETHDDYYLNEFAILIKNIQNYVEDRGSYFLFVINPSKISLYKQYLPEGYNYTNYRINYLKKEFDRLNVNYIDNTEYLSFISKEKQVFNKKYDAGHWNDIGAFYGINNVYSKLIDDNIFINNLNLYDYFLLHEHKDSLLVSEFKIDEEIPILKEKNVNYVITNKYNSKINLDDRALYYLETKNENVDNNYKLMFFRDSYIGGKEKFIANIFNETYLIHSYHNLINVDYYYNIIKPDIVIIDGVEYAINDSYYPLADMYKKMYNPSYKNFKDLKFGNFLKNSKEFIFNNLNRDDSVYNYFKFNDNKKIIHIKKSNLINNYEINKDKDNYNNDLKTINIEKSNFSLAYLKVNNKIYDFIYENDRIYITIQKDLLDSSDYVSIILISKNYEEQQEIIIKRKDS